MLDRSQHLKLFLVGSGDSQEDANAVISDERVKAALNQQPVNPQNLLEAVNRASEFKLNREQKHQFRALFGRYCSAACVGTRSARLSFLHSRL